MAAITETTTPCPAYPVTVYITGGIEFTGGYRSLEIQCLDANNVRVYDWRGHNGGSITGTSFSAGDGCNPVDVHVFNSPSDPPHTVQGLNLGGFTHTISPDDLFCCASFGGGGIWCNNPLGTCTPTSTSSSSGS